MKGSQLTGTMNIKRRTYHLEVCPGNSLQGPSDDEIEAAVRGLPGGVPSYVILTKKKNHFMQAGGGGDDDFQLEFMEFSQDGLWEHKDSTGDGVDIETVVQALVQYANDDDKWRELPWVRLSGEEADRRSNAAREKWEAKQPKPAVLMTMVKGMLGAIPLVLGIGSKGTKR